MSDEPSQAEGGRPPKGWRLVALNALVMGWLAVQLALPVRGFVHDKFESRADFSWNMYSKHFRYTRRYVLLTPDGRGERIDVTELYPPRRRAGGVAHRDRLDAFHAWLCEELARRGRHGTVKARVSARLNFGDSVDLIEPYAEVCTTRSEGTQDP